MKNKCLNFKNTILKSLVLIMTLSASMVVLPQQVSADIIATPYYEKITKQYPSMEGYVANSRKKIKDNWYPSSASFEKSATILLKLNKNGELLDSSISVSSNDEKFDNSLIEAANKTKFSPLPDDVNEDVVDIDMSFKMQRRSIINRRPVEQE